MAAATVTFRRNHLVQLHSLSNAAFNDKLVRVTSHEMEATGRIEVVLLDDRARPPVEVVPARPMMIKPEHFKHACEYCLVVAPDGEKLQICGRCKTARYCNAECQGADWARHKKPDCFSFSHSRSFDMSSLQLACIDGNVAEVRRLVEEEGVDMDKATSNGPTPLATAASHGHLSVVRYLVEKGANVDKARATSLTPLYGAVMHGSLPVVRYLVEHGAEIDNATNDGTTALFSATPLAMAAHDGNLMVVRYLVEQGADKDKADNKDRTPLFMAAKNGHFVVVQYLVEQGVDKNKAANNGPTPLLAAIMKGYDEVAAFLHAAGAGV